MTALENLQEQIITKLKEINIVKYVGQEQGQLQNPEGFQAFATPAILVRPQINDIVQQLGRQNYDINFIFTIITKEITKLGVSTYTLYDVANEIYKKLQGNHFNESCTPMLRISVEQDYIFKDINFGFTTFKTNLFDLEVPESRGYTYSVTPDYELISKYGLTQSKIDLFENNG